MLVLAAIQWSEGIEDAWRSVASFVPDFLGFCLILALGWLAARVVSRVVDRVLERSGFARAMERGGIRRALARSSYDASDIVSRLVFYGLMLLVLDVAFGVFGANPISALLAGVIAFLPRLLVAVLVVVVAAAIAAAVRDIVGNALSGLSYGRTLAACASGAIVVLGVFMALAQLQIAPAIVNALFYAVLAVVAGSAIVAIGGGGIQPMRARWERALSRWDAEAPRLRSELDEERRRRAATAPPAIDLRDQPVAMAATTDDSTLVSASTPASATASTSAPANAPLTQDRIRAEIRSEGDTLP